MQTSPPFELLRSDLEPDKVALVIDKDLMKALGCLIGATNALDKVDILTRRAGASLLRLSLNEDKADRLSKELSELFHYLADEFDK